MTNHKKSTMDEALAEIGALTSTEVATFDWLMMTVGDRFGASDRFDPKDRVFAELTDQLVSRIL